MLLSELVVERHLSVHFDIRSAAADDPIEPKFTDFFVDIEKGPARVDERIVAFFTGKAYRLTGAVRYHLAVVLSDDRTVDIEKNDILHRYSVNSFLRTILHKTAKILVKDSSEDT